MHAAHDNPLGIAIVGFEHGHVEGLLDAARRRDDIHIVGVCESDERLFNRLADKYGLDRALRRDDLDAMLNDARPEAASVMTSVDRHADVIEACARAGVHTLVEKPLAYTRADADRIAHAAKSNGVHVLTNYETSWYASVRETKRRIDAGEIGAVRRMIFRHGHRGPVELGCFPEFLEWLTDPARNGAGALVDFGCYGAILATWLMNGARPRRIIASTSTLKPDAYPRADDDATIILEYEAATAVVMGSWAWTHDNKEMDVHGEGGSFHAGKRAALHARAPDLDAKPLASPPLERPDEWTDLRNTIRGRCAVDPLASLDLNVIVAEILEEAIRQTRS